MNRLLHKFIALALAAMLICGQALTLPAPPANAGLLGDMSVKDEREMGRKFEYLMSTQAPMVEDPIINDYAQSLILRLAKTIPPQPWPISIGVMRAGALNAFAGPAGRMYLLTGLLVQVEHESDLAGVLAHELGHVTARHLSERTGQAKKVGIVSMLGTLAAAALGGKAGINAARAGQAAGQSAMLSFSRDNEREADDLGLHYLVEAGYQPMGLVRAFQTLKRKQFYTGGGVPSYLSTHPGLNERISHLTDRINHMPASIRNRPDDDRTFHRVQTLVRARYTDPTLALSFFPEPKNKDDCLGHMGRGIALERNGRMAEATASFQIAAKCGSNDPLMLREAGRHYFGLGDYQAAGRLLQKAVILQPEDMMSLYFMARIMADTGDLKSAISSMERVAKKHPHDAEVRTYLGNMYGKSGRHFPAHLNLAYAALYQGNLKKAEYHAGLAGRAATSPAEHRELEELGKLAEEFKELAG